MRKLLYAFVFAVILVLAGFTSFASENEPSGGGTVPDEGYTLWLPVVALPLEARYPNCPILSTLEYPIGEEEVSGTVDFRHSSTPNALSWPMGIAGVAFQIAKDSGFQDIVYAVLLTRTNYFQGTIDTADYAVGVYYWRTRAECYKFWHTEYYSGPWSTVETFEIVR